MQFQKRKRNFITKSSGQVARHILVIGLLTFIFLGSILAAIFFATNTSSILGINANSQNRNGLDKSNAFHDKEDYIHDLRKGRYWEGGKDTSNDNQNLAEFKKINDPKSSAPNFGAQDFTSITNGSTVRAGDLIEISGRVYLSLVPGDPTFDATPVGQVIHVYIGSENDPNKKITANATIISKYWPNGAAITNGTDIDKNGVPDDPDSQSQPWVSSSAGYYAANFTFPDQVDWPKFGITSGSSVTIYLRYEENQTLKDKGSPIANSGSYTLARVTVTVSSVGNIIEDQTSPFQGITSQQKALRPGENASGRVITVDSANSPLPSVPLSFQLRNRSNGQLFTSSEISTLLNVIVILPTQTDANGLANIQLNTSLQTPAGDYSLEIIANYTGYTYNGVSYFGVNYDGVNEATNNAIVRLNFTITPSTALDTISITVNVNPQVAELNETSTQTLTNITISVTVNSYWSSIGAYQIPNLIVNITITNNSPVLQSMVFEDLFGFNANFSLNKKSVQVFTNVNGEAKIALNATFPAFFGPGDAIVDFDVTVINPEKTRLSPDGSPPQQPHAWIESSRTTQGTASIHPDYTVGTISIQSIPKTTLRPGESINVTYLVKDQNNVPLPGIPVYLNTTISIPGVSITPYSMQTDINGLITFNVTTTYGISPEDPNGVPLTFEVVADFENDSRNFLIGTEHAGINTFADYNKTWSKTSTSLIIQAIYNYITVDVAINDTTPRPGDAFLVTFTLKNGTNNLVGYDLELLIATSTTNGTVTYSGPTPIVGTGSGNTFQTNGSRLVLEYDTTYPGTSKIAQLSITATLTNSSLKAAFPISDPILRWNVGTNLNASGGNNNLTTGSYSQNIILVNFTPQYRIADVSAVFTPNPSPANTTVTVQATVFLQNGGERVPGVNVMLVPDPSIPSTNITIITTSGITASDGTVTFQFITGSNTRLLDAGTYNFFVIVDLENDTLISVTENNGKQVSGDFINGTSVDGKITNKTNILQVIWINTITVTIDSITDLTNPDAGSNGTDFIAYRQTSNIAVTVSYISQDGSPIANKDITIQLYDESGTYITDLASVTTTTSGTGSSIVTLPNTISVGRFKLVPIPIGDTNVLLNNQSLVVRSALDVDNLQVNLDGNTYSAYFIGNSLDISGTILDELNQQVTTSNYPTHANNLVGKVKVQLVDGNNPSNPITTKQVATFNAATGQFTFNNLQIPTNFAGATIQVNVSIETNPDVDLFRPIVISSAVINTYQDITWTSVRITFNNGSSQLLSNNSQISLVGYGSRVFSISVTLADNHGRPLSNMGTTVTWNGSTRVITTNSSGVATLNDPNFLTFSGLNNKTDTLLLRHELPNKTILPSNSFIISLTMIVFDKASPTLVSIQGVSGSTFINNSFQSINNTTNLIINATIQDLPSGNYTSTGVASVTFIFRAADGASLFTVTPVQSGNAYWITITLNNKTLFQNTEEIHLIIQAIDNAGNAFNSNVYVFYLDFTPPSQMILVAMNVTSAKNPYVLPDLPLGNQFSINITISDVPSAVTQKAITTPQSEGINVSTLIIVLQNGTITRQLTKSQEYTITIISQNESAVTIRITFTISALEALQSSLGLPPETTWELLINVSDRGGNYPSSALLSANITFKLDQTAPDTNTLKIQPTPVLDNNQDSYFVNSTQSFVFQNVTILDRETGVVNVTFRIDLGNRVEVITFTRIGPNSWQATKPLEFYNMTSSGRFTGVLEVTDYMNNTATHQIVFVVSVFSTTTTTNPTIPTTPQNTTEPGTGEGGNPIVNFFISAFMIFGSAVAGVATARFIEILRQRYLPARRS